MRYTWLCAGVLGLAKVFLLAASPEDHDNVYKKTCSLEFSWRLQMKKFSLVLATAGLSASLGAYAAIPTDAKPFQVIVPNIKAGPEIILEGLLLRPHNNDLVFATVSDTYRFRSIVGDFDDLSLINATENSATVNQANPKYNFGFRVALGYVFPDSGNDVQLGWTHFNKGRTYDASTYPGQVLTTGLGHHFFHFDSDRGRFGDVFPDFDRFDDFDFEDFGDNDLEQLPAARSNVNFRYDAVDLDVGQFVDIGTRLRTRLFGGLRYARVKNNVTNDYLANYTFGRNVFVGDAEGEAVLAGDRGGRVTFAEQDEFYSKFNGIGPRFGVDTSYHLGYCFGLVAHVSGSLLVGKVSSSTQTDFARVLTVNDRRLAGVPEEILFEDDERVFIDAHQNNISTTKENRVVPAFDAKLGLDWSYIVPSNGSVISIEAGYQWTQYIDAIDRYHVHDTRYGIRNGAEFVVDEGNGFNRRGPLVDPVLVTKTTSSVGFDGPYLNLSWKV